MTRREETGFGCTPEWGLPSEHPGEVSDTWLEVSWSPRERPGLAGDGGASRAQGVQEPESTNRELGEGALVWWGGGCVWRHRGPGGM